MEKKRIVYVDIVKSFAIFFVCFYHYNNFDNNILNNPNIHTYFTYFIEGIASCGVPLFFMANGAIMFNRKDFDLKRHIIKILRITILTVIWGFLTLLLLMPITGEYLSVTEFMKCLWNWNTVGINHLWFLQTLVCVYIFFPLLKIAYDKNKKITMYFMVAVLILTFGNTLINMGGNLVQGLLGKNYTVLTSFNFFNKFNPFSGFYAYSFVYFILGGFIQQYKSNIEQFIQEKFKLKKMVMFQTVLVFVPMLLLFLYGMFASHFGNSLFDIVWYGYDTIMVLVTSCALFILFSKIDLKGRANKIISIIGKNTLGIYVIHRFVGSFFKPFFVTIPFSSNIIISLLFGLFVMAVSLLLTIL